MNNSPWRLSALTIVAVLSSCFALAGCSGTGSSSPSDPNAGFVGTKAVPAGTWGGTDANSTMGFNGGELDVTPTAATMIVSCGGGPLNGPITPDANGDFVVAGTFVVQIGPPQPVLNVLYVGHASDGRMQLSVVNTATSAMVTSFDLVYGTKGQVTESCPP